MPLILNRQRGSRESRGPISSLAKQLHIAYASDLDHSNLYRPSILLKLTNFNQDGGPSSSSNTSGQQHNHHGKINVYIKLTGHCFRIMPLFSPFFFLHSSHFFFFFSPKHAIAAERRPSRSSYTQKKTSRMTYCVSCKLSIPSEQIERKVLHLPLESEKPSEIHGTCTRSPSLSSAFERMTATSQRVKNLKPILGSPTVFFFFFFLLLPASSGNRGSYRHHSIHFISLVLAPSLLSSSEGSV